MDQRRDPEEIIRERENFNQMFQDEDPDMAYNGQLLHDARIVAYRIFDIVLRLPGLLLMELWWRNRDVSFEDITQEMLSKAPFNSYLDIWTILDFVHRRNFDSSAAMILNYSVLGLSFLMISLPMAKLLKVYAHFVSLALLAFAHYMSTVYVELEASSPDKEIKLDNFLKLERHGFHFLAQMILGVAQSVLLGLDNTLLRVFLCVFSGPIVARMCACPQEKLIVAHNVACSGAMVFILLYVMHRVPNIMNTVRTFVRQTRCVFIVRGLGFGFVTYWRRLQLNEIMTCAWLTMFSIRLYVELFEKSRSWRQAGPVLLSGIAESTNTPISLLALALTIGYLCKWAVDAAQLAIGGRREHGHPLARGYSEALTLVLLCAQTGFIGMKNEYKAFLLGLVLFIVMNALLRSLYELLEPQLLALAAVPNSQTRNHVASLILAGFLILAPLATSWAMYAYLPVDLWCISLVSNGVLTSVHALSSAVQYFIQMVEARAIEPWEKCDDYLFVAKTATRVVELLISICVVIFGFYSVARGNWTTASVVVIVVHVFLNVYQKIDLLMSSCAARRAAVKNISKLAKASKEELKARSDVCAICFMEMLEEARVTPCKHFFHGACLRKWLSIKQVCPLCYIEMKDPAEQVVEVRPVEPPPPPRDGEWREQHRMDGARDMWPLLRERPFDDDSEYDSDSSTAASEYTLASTDNEH